MYVLRPLWVQSVASNTCKGLEIQTLWNNMKPCNYLARFLTFCSPFQGTYVKVPMYNSSSPKVPPFNFTYLIESQPSWS
jgi:hypothetical protein